MIVPVIVKGRGNAEIVVRLLTSVLSVELRHCLDDES
jgi:hypothetical protein